MLTCFRHLDVGPCLLFPTDVAREVAARGVKCVLELRVLRECVDLDTRYKIGIFACLLGLLLVITELYASLTIPQ